MIKRRKINIRQVVASIRLDIEARHHIVVPNEEVRIIYSGGDYREIVVNVNRREVQGVLKGNWYGVGPI